MEIVTLAYVSTYPLQKSVDLITSTKFH